MSRSRRCGGQSSVELIALLPALALLALAGWQLIGAAHGWVGAAGAARVGERAGAVGGDVPAAVRGALPGAWGRRLSVITPPSGSSRPLVVRVRVPQLLPGFPPLRPAVPAQRGAR